MTRDLFMYIILAFIGMILAICCSLIIMYHITYCIQSRCIIIHAPFRNVSNIDRIHNSDVSVNNVSQTSLYPSYQIKEYVVELHPSTERYTSIAIAKNESTSDYQLVIQPDN